MGHNGPILTKTAGNDLLVEGLGKIGRDALNFDLSSAFGLISSIVSSYKAELVADFSKFRLKILWDLYA
jgi:hypothetical protein